MPHRKCGMENGSHVTNIHSPHMYKPKEAIKKTSEECFFWVLCSILWIITSIYLTSISKMLNHMEKQYKQWLVAPPKCSTETPFSLNTSSPTPYYTKESGTPSCMPQNILGGPGPNSTLHVSLNFKQGSHVHGISSWDVKGTFHFETHDSGP